MLPKYSPSCGKLFTSSPNVRKVVAKKSETDEQLGNICQLIGELDEQFATSTSVSAAEYSRNNRHIRHLFTKQLFQTLCNLSFDRQFRQLIVKCMPNDLKTTLFHHHKIAEFANQLFADSVHFCHQIVATYLSNDRIWQSHQFFLISEESAGNNLSQKNCVAV